MKRFTCLILSILLYLTAFAALAEAPASQFGFSIWPYRQSTPCQTAEQTCDPLAQACRATAIPAPQATAAAAPVQSAQPVQTRQPAATRQPTPAPTAQPTTAPSSSRGDYTTTSAAMQEKKVWNLLNADRVQNGLSALPLDERLSELARLKARDMKEQHYFAHTSPTYGSAADMLSAFGYAFRGVGENIAHHATVEKSEAAFMSSSGHRHSILGSQWTKVGVGVWYDDQGFVYVCQLFAR